MKMSYMWMLLPIGTLALAAASPAVFGADSAATPSGAPVLPAGHPSIPAGHPAIPGGSAAGMPGGMEMPPGGALPSGHPAIPGGPPPMAPDAKGTLVIQAVQGTRGGPTTASDAVVVDLMHNGQSVKKIEGKLDAQGMMVLENLAIGTGIRPETVVRHAGVEYRLTGDLMHPSPPDQRQTIIVYESTEQPPAWTIRARHLMVRRVEDGLYVKDMIVIDSPSDRAWLGRAGPEGRRSSLELQLAENTGRVDFYTGFPATGTELKAGRLISHTPLVPGMTQLQFGYVLPITDGKAALDIYSPAPTEQLVVLMPDDGSKATATGLEAADAAEMGMDKMRIFAAKDVKAGQKTSISLTGLAAAAPLPRDMPAPAKPLHPKDGTSSLPQTIALVGGGVVLAGGLGYVIFKRPRPSAKDARN